MLSWIEVYKMDEFTFLAMDIRHKNIHNVLGIVLGQVVPMFSIAVWDEKVLLERGLAG